MPSESKKPRSQGVDPSPTPMMPTAGDSSTVISMPRPMNAWASSIAAIQPAEPPPTMTTRRIEGGTRASRGGCRRVQRWLKTVAVGPVVRMPRDATRGGEPRSVGLGAQPRLRRPRVLVDRLLERVALAAGLPARLLEEPQVLLRLLGLVDHQVGAADVLV